MPIGYAFLALPFHPHQRRKAVESLRSWRACRCLEIPSAIMCSSVAGQHHCFRVPRVIFGAAFTNGLPLAPTAPGCAANTLSTPFSTTGCLGNVYVGYTTCVLRRLRQHNGEISGGARQTRRIRLRTGCEWRVSQVTTGFPDKKSALQFEWAPKHPLRTTALTTLHG